MPKDAQKQLQVVNPKNKIVGFDPKRDDLRDWMTFYFAHHATTAESSRKEQRRALEYFFTFLNTVDSTGERIGTARESWTPRVSRLFVKTLQTTMNEDGARRWSDGSIDDLVAHLKAFAKWIHQHAPFSLGQPMENISKLENRLLKIERALTEKERIRMLDAADQLLIVGGRSRDRNRYGSTRAPRRSKYRPYRNRAIIFILTETGMRRAAAVNANLADVDFKRRIVSTIEKGGAIKDYDISKEGIQAIRDYVEKERPADEEKWQSPVLFLKAANVAGDHGRMTAQMVNVIWKQVRDVAGVSKDRTPHSARHGMGKHIMKKTGNPAMVQGQLNHNNLIFSMIYAQPTKKERQRLLDER